MISVIAKLRIQEGKMDDALAACRELVSEVANEPGTLLYTLNTLKNDPNLLVFMERYQDKEALNAHSSTPYFQAFFAKAGELLDGEPEITIMREAASI